MQINRGPLAVAPSGQNDSAASPTRSGVNRIWPMEACRSELSFHPRDLQLTCVAVAEDEGRLVGVAQVAVVGDEADLLKRQAGRR
jgi:hypothetical protein